MIENIKEDTFFLDARMKSVLEKIENTQTYSLISDYRTNDKLVLLIVKNILLEVFSYGPHITEATFTAIGRFPKNRPDLIKPLIEHDVSEVNHGEMALKDFVKLGGDEKLARNKRISYPSFNMAATCRMLAERECPYSFLGYMYPFEAITPIITERAIKFLAEHNFPLEAQFFINFHAKEDIEHEDQLKKIILKIIDEFPSAKESIQYGFDCFANVYPLPIWDYALKTAIDEFDT